VSVPMDVPTQRQAAWNRHWQHAVGKIEDRHTSERRGLEDLVKLHCAARRLGASIDTLPYDDSVAFTSFAMLFEELEEVGEHSFGRLERTRITEAHDIQLASSLSAIAQIEAEELDAAAGIYIHACTVPTVMRRGSRGVVVHPGGGKTVTLVFASVAGGAPGSEYSHVVLADFAGDPLDVDAVGRQAFDLGVRARELTRELIHDIGPLPIVGGTIAAAELDGELEVVERPVALGDLPAVVEHAARTDEPFVLMAFLGEDGDLRAPDDYWLDLTPPAALDTERPGACGGAMVAIRHDIVGRLLRPPAVVAEQLFLPLPDCGGVGQVTRGGVMVPISRWRSHPVAAATFRPYDGGEWIALTNIRPTEQGPAAIARALAALFSGEPTRTSCRERAGRFAQRFAISTTSLPGSRTVAGMFLLAFAPTVPKHRAALLS